ncbi:MAG: protein translocase subunit SecD [Oscillospiraceae bacterium]|nr:MAG: protein translocase subunit SecD [Oscillospiraceae bacterium]
MKTKSVITLVVVILLLAVLAVFSLGVTGKGVTIGITRFKPWYENVKLGMDIKGGVTVIYEAKEKEGSDFDAGIKRIITIFENRLSSKGYSDVSITQQGTNRIRVEIADVASVSDVSSLLGTPGKLEFRDDEGNVICTGDQLKSATYLGQDGSDYVVSITFDSDGTKSFAEATKKALEKKSYIAIYMDGSEYSRPTVNAAITDGKAVITCATAEAANNMAIVLQSGAMPLDITEISASVVSATLGSEALNSALIGGLIGVILVFVFMLVVYRFMGLAADIALFVYMLIFYWFITSFPWMQLTLPSIAGIVLSIGMAVDANVVIFERIKEEFYAGKDLDSCVSIGYTKARSAILDANLTTIIAGLVMLMVGPAPIKNFATTLLAGVVISMLTAIFVTRYFLNVLIKLGINKPGLLSLKEGKADEK